MANALGVWMNGEHVGIWHATRGGTSTFKYDPSWTASPAARPLSLSLPITAGASEHRGTTVTSYFDNLLPDSDVIRRRLARRFRTQSLSSFDLLTAIGRDCVGAVQLSPADTEPVGWNLVRSEVLGEQQVEQILRAATSDAPLGQSADPDDFRISIAGAQEKTALLRYGGAWRRPHGPTPTTHILKLPLGIVGHMRADMEESVENEWLCAQVLRELGLPVANSEMATFGSQRALVVERFDRRWMGVAQRSTDAPRFKPGNGTWIARLPQEDFCQATGTPPSLKYEADGGPSMGDCLDILASSGRPSQDRLDFVLAQLAFWLLAATDGHAKNFSIFHLRGGSFEMTPLYDVISAWPIIGKGPKLIAEQDARLAMSVRSKNAHSRIREIRSRHWKTLATRTGIPLAWERMLHMATAAGDALERIGNVLPKDFPSRVFDRIRIGVTRSAKQFLREADSIVGD